MQHCFHPYTHNTCTYLWRFQLNTINNFLFHFFLHNILTALTKRCRTTDNQKYHTSANAFMHANSAPSTILNKVRLNLIRHIFDSSWREMLEFLFSSFLNKFYKHNYYFYCSADKHLFNSSQAANRNPNQWVSKQVYKKQTIISCS
jgi:hypothetical protein